MCFLDPALLFYPLFMDELIPRKVIQIGKYKYRIVYMLKNDSKEVVRLQKKRATIFGSWAGIMTDTYDACIEELRSRVREYRSEKEKRRTKPRLAPIKPKDLE